jgi:hypothetical protein
VDPRGEAAGKVANAVVDRRRIDGIEIGEERTLGGHM